MEKISLNIHEIRDKIISIVHEKFSIVINLETELSDGGLDSLDQIELIIALEDFFNIGIDEEEAVGIKNVYEMGKIIAEKLGIEQKEEQKNSYTKYQWIQN